MKRQFVIAMLIVFISLDILFRVLKANAPEYHITALQICNILMAILSIAAYYLVNRQLSGRPQAFVRGVFSASFLKLFVSMSAMLAYVLLNKSHIHKPTVFMLFGVYAAYSAVETILASRSAKVNK